MMMGVVWCLGRLRCYFGHVAPMNLVLNFIIVKVIEIERGLIIAGIAALNKAKI